MAHPPTWSGSRRGGSGRRSQRSKDRGDHGFLDEPSKLFFLDVDGVKINWKADPERAIRTLVAQLGEPWCLDVVRAGSSRATHGLEA